MTDRSRRVVLLIDYDNLQICAARDTPGRELQLTPVVQLAQRYGTVILSRAYAEWNLSTERLAVYKAGIEPAFAPVLRTESDRSGKSLADTVMVAEGMDMLWTLSPEVVVLATSDKDLIPLVRVAKQRGAFVVVLGSDFTAIPLREMADEHVTYRQLITEAGLRYATEAGPGRQPAALPEPSRRRRERSGRERGTGAAAPAGTPAPSRPEREPAAASAPGAAPEAPTPTAAAAAPGSTATPNGTPAVAPITSTMVAEGDTQAGGRRRRRRGSRRRADRLGVGGEYVGSSESDVLAPEGELPEPAEEPITPTTSAVDVVDAIGVEPSVTPPDEIAPEPAAEPVAAPRERRRRTRRITAPEVAPTSADEPEQAPTAPVVPEQVPAVPVVPEQSADIPPAPAPETTSVNGANAEAEEAPATPARRPRRIASASRGRSRRP
jgi:uncharacterized LabA/DUF88 family protein